MLTSSNGRICVFLGLTVALTSVFWAFVIATGHNAGGRGAYAVGSMWSPGVAALITCRICGVKISSLGWGWGKWRDQRIAYLIPLGYAIVAYLIIWGTDLGGFPNQTFITSTRESLGWPNTAGWLVTASWFVFLATTGVVRTVANTLGEEIGWRGFLAPELTVRFGFTGGALITGVIWTVWHFPELIFADYNSGTPWWFGMTCFSVMVVSLSVIMSWIRLKSGSIWAAAILHASHNTFIQGFFTPLTVTKGSLTAYAIDEFGFVLPLVVTGFAVVFWLKRREAIAAFFTSRPDLSSPR